MKELQAKAKVTQTMTRDGLVVENQADGTVENISSREAEQDYSTDAEGKAEKILERVEDIKDKHKAKKKLWRIPEATLMTVAALGGSVGSLLGMYTVRHKTKHPKFTIGIPLLLAGRIDATLNAEVVFADYQKAHPEANIKIATYSDDVERVAIPVRKSADTATLLAAINQALAELDADGTLSALSVKYFGTDISKMS